MILLEAPPLPFHNTVMKYAYNLSAISQTTTLQVFLLLHAWVISLTPHTKEAIELQKILKSEGIETTIKPAVDGRLAFPELKEGENLSQLKALLYRRHKLTTSEVGCYLSHYRLIKEAYEKGLKHICLFESDVVAEPGIGDVIRSIADLPDKYHFVRLMYLKKGRRTLLDAIDHTHRLVKFRRTAVGAQGYVLNREGMKRVIKSGRVVYQPIDGLYDSFFLTRVNTYCIEPHAIHEVIHESSIIKSSASKKDSRLWVILGWFFFKQYRSLLRKLYYIIHFSEFYPASKPKDNISVGKSPRLR